MIYLTNTVSAQTVSIPRNDNGGTPSVNPRSYQEGYNAGEAHQKSLLSSTAITENGEYSRENGFSAVSVNVPQTGSSLPLTAITITANTAITETEKAYTGITVNVPQTGYTQQDLDNAYNSGYTSGNIDGYASGYASGETAGYNSGYTSGETHQKSLLSSTAITENGEYQSENGFSAVSVNVPQTGITIPLTSITITANTAITESEKAYTGITVNVPQTGYTQQDLDDAYVSGYTSGEKHQKSLLSSTAITENGVYTKNDGWSAITVSTPQPTGYTIETKENVYLAFNDTKISINPTKNNIQVTEIIPNKKFSLDASNVTDIPSNSFLYLGHFQNVTIHDRYAGNSVIYNGNTFLVDSKYSDYPFTATTNNKVLTIEFHYSAFEWIGNGDGREYDLLSSTTVTFKPDLNLVSTSITMTDTYQTFYPIFQGLYITGGSVSCLYLVESAITSGFTSGYTSGYTDGYSSGFSSGQTSIIDTFTAITATTNGVYGSSAHPLSSITVNVPSGKTEAIISVTGNTWFVLDHIFQYGEKINIKHVTFDYSAANIVRHQQLISGGYNEYLRIGGNGTGNKLYVTYGNTNKAQTNYILTNNEIELTPTEFYIDGVKVANVTSSTYTWNTNMVLFANTSAGSDSVSNQTASVGEITITDSANTITAHYVPTLDGNNVPCFYNTVSDNYIYAESGTPIYNSTVSFLTIDNLARRRYTYINPHISVNPRPYSFYEATELYGDLSFGNSVTSIGYAAFEACDNLNGTLTIPNSVTGIGEYAFAAEFSGTLTIPDSITEIKKGAFYGCNFTTVIIPSSVTDIKSTAFFWNQETDIYCYATTPPLIDDRIVGYSSSGRIHYPAGSDYTLWTQSSQFANWTFIDDL